MAKLKITYSTLSADNQELQAAYEDGLRQAQGELGQTYPLYIGGEARQGNGTTDNLSPTDTRIVLGKFATGSEQDALDAVAAAGQPNPRGKLLVGGSASKSCELLLTSSQNVARISRPC